MTEEEQEAKRKFENFRDTMIKAVAMYVVLAAIIIGTFRLVLMLNYIPSGSMENTLMTDDIVVATRYDKTDVDRYDIMVFKPLDEPDAYYIKRVIGLPGETIVVHEGEVYADGVALDDSFIREEMTNGGDGTFEVPEGCYFMLGDNRNHSLDARFWDEKYVPVENMTAKARFVVWPFNHIGSVMYQGNP